MNTALLIMLGFLLLSLFLGLMARRGKDMNMEQWAVGGRGFGTAFVFLLLAGEIYTTSTFLGTSGWSYSKGGPAFYILCTSSLSYLLGYWLLPPIWRYAKEHKLVSQSDFFAIKYKSKGLGVLVALVGVLALIPYLILQFKGLGIIVSAASYGSISPSLAIVISTLVITVYVSVSGIHGSAWTAVMKDILIFIIVLFLGIYLPYHYYGGIQSMFEAVNEAKPNFLIVPEKGLSFSWFISTTLLTVIGFSMWPHTFAAYFSAKSTNVFKKNTIIMPLYTLMLPFVLIVGFTAILQVPGLTGPNGDLALLKISIQTFDPWFVGFIGAAGLLTGVVPGSLLLMAASTAIAKNIYQVIFPATTDAQLSRVAKLIVPVIALVCMFYAIFNSSTIMTLLLMGYNFVTQLFPPLLASLVNKRFFTKQGAAAGMLVGVSTVIIITLNDLTIAQLFPGLPQAIQELNIGFIAVLLNTAVLILVSMLTRKQAIHTNNVGLEKGA
ncbi:sodium:solute symporter family protein [Paenibacillus chitinolyticus]|uniref:Sodium:solute symporter family protein n=1 Tax=Paenibacillus chitinolyticus TaxID=79263 RepID=A0A410WRN7_9BACL|nr:sodium:solute symporter family protein [Paenibacillus chitinolyticus]MCY9592028.1 sodium:solute symporter family protein [Paenibacillus chitinolyticus]MCY9598875.1 sodium:solute symporter family protein [Paenibacillus chitinolyticus]QAV17078.1 sodium:solute symporter family protein [Paenibacillus chitinolyticus]